MSYLVTSPLVLVKVPDQVGEGYRLDYHYQGSVVPWLSDEQAKHFLAEGLVVEVGSTPAEDNGEKPPADATNKVLIAWLVANVAKEDGSDYTEAELKPLNKAALQELIDSVE